MLKSLILHKSNYKPGKDGIDHSSPFEIPLVYSIAYHDARLQIRKEFLSAMVGNDEPDTDLKELIALTCKTFFDKEIEIANINTMDNAFDLVVSICPEACTCRLIPVTYPHYDVKGDPYGRDKVVPGNGSFPRYQYVTWQKLKLSLASYTIVETVHTFCITLQNCLILSKLI